MTEEFNLSEKIFGVESPEIKVKYVKEFIRRLKEELIQENVWDEENMGIIEKKIDKLAGKDLI